MYVRTVLTEGCYHAASGLAALLRLLRPSLHPLHELLTAHGHEAFLLRLPIHKRRDSVIDLQYTYGDGDCNV